MVIVSIIGMERARQKRNQLRCVRSSEFSASSTFAASTGLYPASETIPKILDRSIRVGSYRTKAVEVARLTTATVTAGCSRSILSILATHDAQWRPVMPNVYSSRFLFMVRSLWVKNHR